jgi:3-dehydroquinate synthase
MEQLTGYALRHGEAVALGICIDLAYARLEGYITKALFEEVLGLFTDLGFPTALPEGIEAGQVLKGLEEFREHLGGELTITLIKGVGRQYDVHEIDQALMTQAIEVMKAPTLHRTS